MRVFWNPQDPLRRSRQAAPVFQAILAVCKATSGAASTGVADLKAALEMAQTKSIQYEVEPDSAKAFLSMQLLEGEGPRDTIAMMYNNGTSHFCKPLQSCGTGGSMVYSSRHTILLNIMHRVFTAQG